MCPPYLLLQLTALRLGLREAGVLTPQRDAGHVVLSWVPWKLGLVVVQTREWECGSS